jgi:hypothetical protein
MVFGFGGVIDEGIPELAGMAEGQLRREHEVDATESCVVHVLEDALVLHAFEGLHEEEVADFVVAEASYCPPIFW